MWPEMGFSLFVQALGSQQLGHHIGPQQRATLEGYVFWRYLALTDFATLTRPWVLSFACGKNPIERVSGSGGVIRLTPHD